MQFNQGGKLLGNLEKLHETLHNQGWDARDSAFNETGQERAESRHSR